MQKTKQKIHRQMKGRKTMDNNPIGELMQTTMENVKNILKVAVQKQSEGHLYLPG